MPHLGPVSTLPPAGWYDDPEQFGSLRYWDGHQWTEHRAPGHGGVAGVTATGRLSSVGSWLQASLTTIWERRVPIGIFTGVSVLLWVLMGAVAAWGIADMRWSVDDGWTGVDGGRLTVVGIVALANLVVGLVLYLAIADQIVWGRLGEDRAASSSLGAALVGLPRLIGWSLVLILVVIGAVFVITVSAVVAPLLAFFVGLAAVIAMLWLYVKAAFLFVAAVAPAPDKNALAASAEVSRGRFWPVVGRLIVAALLSGGVSFAMSIPLSASGPTQDEVDEAIVTDGDELISVEFDALAELAGLEFGVALVFSAIVQSLTPLFSLAATAALYTEIHGRPGRAP